MTDLIKVKEHSDLARDISSGAVINVNKAAYKTAIRTAQLMQERESRMEMMRKEINTLREAIDEIRELLRNKGNV